MDKRKKRTKHIKAVDDTFVLPVKKGNGILRYSVSTNAKGEIMRYSLAYINPNLCSVDNGRVLGFDNCHGRHHRHHMGKEEDIEFTNHEDLVDRFEIEWSKIHEKAKKQKR